MEWKLTLAQRIRAGAALIVVFLLVLATNMIDRNHFTIVKESLTTFYKDRFIAKDYIYKISRQLHIKKDLIFASDESIFNKVNQNANDSIITLVVRFSQTKLTEKEAIHFLSLQRKLDQLIEYEEKLTAKEGLFREKPSPDVINKYYSDLFNELDILSAIQLEEGKREVSLSNRTISSSNFISRLEIGTLIVIGILFQALIFIKPMK